MSIERRPCPEHRADVSGCGTRSNSPTGWTSLRPPSTERTTIVCRTMARAPVSGAGKGSHRVQTRPDSLRPPRIIHPAARLFARLRPTASDRWNLYGMQKVRGPNPLSSMHWFSEHPFCCQRLTKRLALGQALSSSLPPKTSSSTVAPTDHGHDHMAVDGRGRGSRRTRRSCRTWGCRWPSWRFTPIRRRRRPSCRCEHGTAWSSASRRSRSPFCCSSPRPTRIASGRTDSQEDRPGPEKGTAVGALCPPPATKAPLGPGDATWRGRSESQ